MRKFLTLWAGYLISVLGSALTALALGVWVFQETGSATLYAVTLILNFLPGIVFSPLAGALVDRWNRRTVLAVSNGLNAVAVLSLAAIYFADRLQPWHIFVAIGVQSLLRALTMPAMNAVVVLLVPTEQVARANGMLLLAQGLGSTVGFAIGGVLLIGIGLSGVLLIDCASFLVNAALLLAVAIPRPPRSETAVVSSGRLTGEIKDGYRYLSARPGLVSLALFYAALNFSLGYVDVALTPVVLSFASAEALGFVVAAAGVGAVLGSVALTAWGGPRRRINGLAGFALPLGLFLCLGAVRPNVVLITVAAFGFTACSTVIDGTSRSLLQLEVDPDLQGRVFATFSMITNAALCTSFLVGGPVADHVFEPLLREGGGLAGSVGSVIGVGPGRGTAFLVLLIGVFVLLTAITAYLRPGLRSFPDRPSRAALPELEPASEPGDWPSSVPVTPVPPVR